MKIEQKDIDKIRGLIKKETGIDIDPRKDYFLKARIEKRILATGCDSVRAYIHILMFEKDVEFQELVEEVTINETYFFRDFPQLQGFAELALEDYCKDKRAKNDYKVYVIKGRYKRWIQRAEIFNAYGHLHWEDVIEVEPEILDAYQTSWLIRAKNDYKVYEVTPSGVKRWLNMTPSEFEKSGRKWEMVYIVNDFERDFYHTGKEITII